MSIEDFIQSLSSKNVGLTNIGDQLRIDGPRHELSVEVLNFINKKKVEIQAYLASKESFKSEPIEELEYYSLAPVQRMLWLFDNVTRNRTAYNVFNAYTLKGEINTEVLEKAFQTLISRHEVLRTRFCMVNGEPKQRYFDVEVVSPCVEVVDLRIMEDSESEAMTVGQLFLDNEFDLTGDLLIKLKLLLVEDSKSYLLVLTHHIITDDQSSRIIFSELSEIYRNLMTNGGVGLPPLKFQFKDYVSKTQFYSDASSQYWRAKLDSFKQSEFPTSFPRKVSSNTGANVHLILDEQQSTLLLEICRERGVTMYCSLLGAVSLLVAKSVGSCDLIFGIPVSTRSLEFQNTIGMFVNVLPLRITFNKDYSFSELVRIVHHSVIEALSHRYFPLEEIISESNIEISKDRNPLFDIMISLEVDEDGTTDRSCNEQSTPVRIASSNRTTKYDLVFNFKQIGTRLSLVLDFNTNLFTDFFVDNLVKLFKESIRTVTANPERPIRDLEIITQEDAHHLFMLGNASLPLRSTGESLIGLFETQCMKSPDSVAIVCEGVKLSFKEVNCLSNSIANKLRLEYGVLRNTLVGIVMEKGIDTILSIVGILKSGGAYVPIDPQVPRQRLRYILEAAGITLVITDGKWMTSIPDNIIKLDIEVAKAKPVEENLNQVNVGSDLAYVIFTSGSTGTPKGVMVERNNLVSAYSAWRFHYNLGDRPPLVLQLAESSFDVFTGDWVRSILNGGQLVICPDIKKLNWKYLYELITRHDISILESVPALIVPFCDYLRLNGLEVRSLKVLILGSDVCTKDHFIRVAETIGCQCRILNSYGLTEATIDSSYYEFQGNVNVLESSVPIGRPIMNTSFYILNDDLQLVPRGMVGELFIGGLGVSRGYINLLDPVESSRLNDTRFLVNPFNANERLFRTGDLVKWTDDGNVTFCGRTDSQLKIRGYRVEIGEIENNVLRFPNVIGCAVVVVESQSNEKSLRCFFVAEKPLEAKQLRHHLTGYLAEYMIPSSFVQIAQLPLTFNGKVDRKLLSSYALPEVKIFAPPTNQIEEDIMSIWAKVLRRKEIGLTDNFFELGGHSLSAIQIVAEVSQKISETISIRDLFENPSVKELAAVLSSRSTAVALGIVNPIEEQDHYPVSRAQKGIWIQQQIEPALSSYNIPETFIVRGNLQIEILERSLAVLVAKHEILRTAFLTIDDVARQKVLQPSQLDKFFLFHDIQNDENKLEALSLIVDKNAKTAFQLVRPPLMRVDVIKTQIEEFTLVITWHHIIFDAWSEQNFINQLILIYNSFRCESTYDEQPFNVQFKDRVVWENALIGYASESKAFWLKALQGPLPKLAMDTDFSRPRVRSFKGARLLDNFEDALVQGLNIISKRHGTTSFMTWLAVLKTLFFRYTGQVDIIIGTSFAGRDKAEFRDQLGLYVNMLPLRTKFAPDVTFNQLLLLVKMTCLNVYENQYYPFDQLIQDLNLKKELSHSSVFDVLLVNTHTVEGEIDRTHLINDLSFSSYSLESGQSKFDLVFSFPEVDSGVAIDVSFSTDIFKRDRIERMISHIKLIVSSVVENFGEIRLGDIELASANEFDFLDNDFEWRER